MDKPYLLMLPGWSMDKGIWESFSENLSGRFKIIYMDWSDLKSSDSFKEKVAEAILKVETDKISILGWSLGAEVALEFSLNSPELVEKLILISATARFTQDRASGYRVGWSKRVIEKMKQNLEFESAETLSEFRKNLFSESERESGRAKSLMEKLESSESKDMDSLKLGLDYLMETDLRERLKSLKVQTLAINGLEDKIVSVDAAKYMESISKKYIELKVLNGCGHIPFQTEGELCLRYIYEFLDKGKRYDR